jgi:hypothetical protein
MRGEASLVGFIHDVSVFVPAIGILQRDAEIMFRIKIYRQKTIEVTQVAVRAGCAVQGCFGNTQSECGQTGWSGDKRVSKL